MNSRFRLLTLSALAMSALTLAAGCETSKCKTDEGEDAACAESLERYTVSGAEWAPAAIPYTAGMGVDINNVKGHIHVDQGAAGQVSVQLVPFTYRGHSQDESAKNEIENLLVKDFNVDNANNIFLYTEQGDGSSDELGATVYVSLPPEFDGNLKVLSRGIGNIEESDILVNYVANAVSVDVESSHGMGDCDVEGAPSVVNSRAYCNGRVQITNVSDNVNATSTGNFTADEQFAVHVMWAGISDTATGGTITSTEGHVKLELPATGNFSVSAISNADGSVQETGSNAACMTAEAAATSKTITCGTGGANFDVSAATEDSLNPGDVYVIYN